jgi:hypothetical protein
MRTCTDDGRGRRLQQTEKRKRTCLLWVHEQTWRHDLRHVCFASLCGQAQATSASPLSANKRHRPLPRTATGVVLIQELPAGCAALFAGRFPRSPGDDAARRPDHISGME